MNKRKVEISASIMCIDWMHVAKQIDELVLEDINYLHFDVIDGHFAPDFTMGSSIINKIRSYCKIRSDYHLMIEEPKDLFDAFDVNFADIVTIHQECCRNLHRDVISLRNKGVKVGVALAPATPLASLDYIIEDLDVILILTVDPGFMGQKMVPITLKKIEDARNLIDKSNYDIKISVDGNVNYENIPQMVKNGADILVGGSSGLFRNDISLKESILRMKECIDKGL